MRFKKRRKEGYGFSIPPIFWVIIAAGVVAFGLMYAADRYDVKDLTLVGGLDSTGISFTRNVQQAGLDAGVILDSLFDEQSKLRPWAEEYLHEHYNLYTIDQLRAAKMSTLDTLLELDERGTPSSSMLTDLGERYGMFHTNSLREEKYAVSFRDSLAAVLPNWLEADTTHQARMDRLRAQESRHYLVRELRRRSKASDPPFQTIDTEVSVTNLGPDVLPTGCALVRRGSDMAGKMIRLHDEETGEALQLYAVGQFQDRNRSRVPKIQINRNEFTHIFRIEGPSGKKAFVDLVATDGTVEQLKLDDATGRSTIERITFDTARKLCHAWSPGN